MGRQKNPTIRELPAKVIQMLPYHHLVHVDHDGTLQLYGKSSSMCALLSNNTIHKEHIRELSKLVKDPDKLFIGYTPTSLYPASLKTANGATLKCRSRANWKEYPRSVKRRVALYFVT